MTGLEGTRKVYIYLNGAKTVCKEDHRGDIYGQPGDGRGDQDLRSADRRGDRREDPERRRHLLRVQKDLVCREVEDDGAGGGDPGRGGRGVRPPDDERDGQDARGGYRRGAEVRPRLPLLRRERRALSRRRGDGARGR